jgi:hypothetical protein
MELNSASHGLPGDTQRFPAIGHRVEYQKT